MLELLLLFLVYVFLTVGAVQYLICVTTPRLRRYALSAALWWAVWGPCSCVLVMMGGMMLETEMIVRENGGERGLHVPHFPFGLGWAYLIFSVVACAAVGTAVAWIHQAVVRQFTFALFRLYAMAFAGGVGAVFGLSLGWWILGSDVRFGWELACVGELVLVLGFGVAAYKGARALRGEAPTSFALVSREEFEGIPEGLQ